MPFPLTGVLKMKPLISPSPKSIDVITVAHEVQHAYKKAVREAATTCPRPLQVDLWPFDIGVRVTCDVGYLCANFSIPRPLCSRLRSDVRDRQTSDVTCASSLNAPYPKGGGVKRKEKKEKSATNWLNIIASNYSRNLILISQPKQPDFSKIT